jgi:competence protein ComEA
MGRSAPSAHHASIKDRLMFKRILVAFMAFLAFSVFAADVNTATQADLEAIKGVGPAIATKIVDERKNGNFKDWPDLVNRVKGIGATSAGKLSTAGLTVNGATYAGAPAPAAKPATPVVAKTATAAPAAAASTANPKVAVLAKTSTIAPAASAPAAPASSAKELKKAAADAKKADKAQKKADKAAAAASAASAAKK